MIYGAFDVPDGAEHRVVLTGWPNVDEVVSEIDLDRDGTPDSSETIPGRPASPPTDVGISADLSIEKILAPKIPPERGGRVDAYSFLVANEGPADADNVTLVVTLPDVVEVLSAKTTNGRCQISDHGVTCALGSLREGERAMITYLLQVEHSAWTEDPGRLVSGATVFGDQWDPDWTDTAS